MNDSKIVYELQSRLKELLDEMKIHRQGITLHENRIKEHEDSLRILNIIYTSLLNTAVKYKEFDQEEFESGL